MKFFSLKFAISTVFISIFIGLFHNFSIYNFSQLLNMISSQEVEEFLINGLGFVFCFVNSNLVIFYLSYLTLIIPIKIYNLILEKIVNYSKQ